MGRMFATIAVVLSAAGMWSTQALAKGKPPSDPFGNTTHTVTVEPLSPIALGVSPSYFEDGGGGSGGGCWTASGRAGDDTLTGSYYLYFQPSWCGNGSRVTAILSTNHYPSVSGWYSFDGDDGAWGTQGCVGCEYIVMVAQGRFSWHAPFYTSYTTLQEAIWMTGGGVAYSS